MKRTLDLNLIQKNPLSWRQLNWLSGLMLLGSLILAGALLYQFQLKKNAAMAEIMHLSKKNMQVKPSNRSAALTKYSQDEVMIAEKVLSELNVSWEAMLDALEQVNQKNVQLLQLSPNKNTRQVLITGQAKDLPAVFAYIDALTQTTAFSNVYLQKHDTAESPDNAILFTLIAKWRYE